MRREVVQEKSDEAHPGIGDKGNAYRFSCARCGQTLAECVLTSVRTAGTGATSQQSLVAVVLAGDPGYLFVEGMTGARFLAEGTAHACSPPKAARPPLVKGQRRIVLSDDDIAEIRELYSTGDYSMKAIATHFCVHWKTIDRHVKDIELPRPERGPLR